jgi:transposase
MVTDLARANELLEKKTVLIAQQQEQLKEKQAHIEELTRKLHSTQQQLKALQHQVEQLLKRLYGRSSEKFDPNQLRIFKDKELIEAIEGKQAGYVVKPPEQITAVEKKRPHKARRKHLGRIPIPEHLERVEIIIDIPEEQKICPKTGKPLKQIGWEISEKLEYRPGRLFVNVYKRPKYVSAISDIIIAPMPDHPIEKCKADIGLLSQIIVSKFADHLPLYRQDGIFEREGVMIPRSTQTSWLLECYEAIKPLGEILKQVVLGSGILFTDDTPIPLQVKGHGRVKKGRLWVYIRGGPGPPLVVYDFSPDRSKRRPLDFLSSYRGYIHADAYSGYDELFKRDGVIEVGCWVHTRRKFDEAVSSRPREATEIMAHIAQIYKVESECKDMTAEDRRIYRQTHARAIIDRLFSRVEDLIPKTTPSEPLRKAITYALNQREALYRYLDNGWLKPDNNTAENAIRPLALGRKNWLFAGSERGGKAAALYYSLIESCKACGVNPWQYLNDVLRRIMSHPINRLRELLPDKWTPML